VRIIRLGKQSDLLNLVMYPNPATNELRVTVPAAWQNKPVMLEVYSLNGQKMKSIQNNASGQTETIAVNDLANGFYLLKASFGSESVQQKFIKK
ncbi:MAG TPA: T9SS type A sorting domain-containing protein, partial [Chitinophagaceae bacterium]|nr:T9SS type A sorting domain-containing protein [Chitinophagaceae bacterium]